MSEKGSWKMHELAVTGALGGAGAAGGPPPGPAGPMSGGEKFTPGNSAVLAVLNDHKKPGPVGR